MVTSGLGATAYYLSKGIKAASKGESLRLAEALQKRVVGQFGTLVIFMGTFAYMVATNPEKQKSAMENDALLKARGLLRRVFLFNSIIAGVVDTALLLVRILL